MTRLKELLDTFIEVIVHYHNIKMLTPVDKASQLTMELKTLPRMDMNARLLTLIKESTNTDGSKTRLSLMMYLLYNIDHLKSCIDYPGIMPEESFNTIKTQWIQMLLDIHTLLKRSHYHPITIKYNEKEESIPGLVRGPWKGFSFCTAGTLLQQAMHKISGSSIDVPAEKLTHTLLDYFNDHELEMSKQALKDEQKKVEQLTREIDDEQKRVEELTQEVDRLRQTNPSVASIESPISTPQKPAVPIGFAFVYPCTKTIITQPLKQSDFFRPRPSTPANLSLPRVGSSHSMFNTTFWSNFLDRRASASQSATAAAIYDDIDDPSYTPGEDPFPLPSPLNL